MLFETSRPGADSEGQVLRGRRQTHDAPHPEIFFRKAMGKGCMYVFLGIYTYTCTRMVIIVDVASFVWQLKKRLIHRNPASSEKRMELRRVLSPMASAAEDAASGLLLYQYNII